MSAISGEPSVEIACAVLECGAVAQWMCAARVFHLSIHVVSEILSLSLGSIGLAKLALTRGQS